MRPKSRLPCELLSGDLHCCRASAGEARCPKPIVGLTVAEQSGGCVLQFCHSRGRFLQDAKSSVVQSNQSVQADAAVLNEFGEDAARLSEGCHVRDT